MGGNRIENRDVRVHLTKLPTSLEKLQIHSKCGNFENNLVFLITNLNGLEKDADALSVNEEIQSTRLNY